MALSRLGHRRLALAACRRAVALDAANALFRWNLASMLHSLGCVDEAIEAAAAILDLPAETELLSTLAAYLSKAGCFDGAAQARARTLAMQSPSAEALTDFGSDLCAAGRVREGMNAYLAALAAAPGFPPAESNLLFTMHLDESYSPGVIAAAHRNWGVEVASRIRPQFEFAGVDRRPGRPLRVGYLASDLRRHSIVHFLAPLLDGHDRREYAVSIFANVTSPDQTTERLRAGHHAWFDVHELTPEEMARRIYAERIDVLIEVGGHTSPKTLRVLAYKPAPVQIAYLAYPDTTGLRTVDYLWTDSSADPLPEAAPRYSETLLHLDPCLLCYRPPEADPGLRRRARTFTFGSFAQRQKLSPRTLRLWAAALRAVPESRLLLKARAWREPPMRRELAAYFEGRGIAPERAEFHPHAGTTGGHLDLYNEVDVALDTFPYSGITTTCEALWMGVPVVALPGGNQVSRIAASILEAAGMGEWVASSDADYVEIAARAANAIPDKEAVREKFRRSAVMDEADFARRADASLRQVWRAFAAS